MNIIAGHPRETIAERLSKLDGVTTGFDYLRLGLAISIICWHSIVVSYGVVFEAPYWDKYRSLVGLILPMFFALSGFLVTGSLLRNPNLPKFLALRAIRIIPALSVEVLLSALIIGPLVTTSTWQNYFTDSGFRDYFLNVAGIISYNLPGVFMENPVPWVNISLWTIPYELECYIILSIAVLVRFFRFRILMLLLVIACVILSTVLLYTIYPGNQFGRPDGRLLVTAFLCGVLFNQFQDKIPLNRWIFSVALVASLILLSNVNNSFLALIPVTYMTVYIGLLNPPKKTFLLQGDYSYGLYLFAFPIQQVYSLLFPEYRFCWANIVFTLLLGIAYAHFSWFYIEKPILERRKFLIKYFESKYDYIKEQLKTATLIIKTIAVVVLLLVVTFSVAVKYQSLKIPVVNIVQLQSHVVPDGAWNAEGNTVFTSSIEIVLPLKQRLSFIDISLDNNDRYKIEYFFQGTFRTLIELGPNPIRPGMIQYTQKLNALTPPTDRLRITAIEGDGMYSIGHFFLHQSETIIDDQ